MTAWYNENNPRMANVLRELIHEGLIAPGVVDERSIMDVRAEDLRGFAQCHFFAGIGVWSHALLRAGWPSYRPIWTGSCPCQPFSDAGNGRGFDDPRHLWPHWFRLISECRPGRVFGEQVASAGQWLDLVHADMEGLGFAVAAVDLAAAGFAGAHVRQRFFWVADAHDSEWWADHAPRHVGDWSPTGRLEGYGELADSGALRRVAHPDRTGSGELRGGGLLNGERAALRNDADGRSALRRVAYADGGQLGDGDLQSRRQHGQLTPDGGPSVDWLYCTDASWRPVEPGSFPLVDEAPARLGRLHGYGNAIDAETLTQFIGAYVAAVEDRP